MTEAEGETVTPTADGAATQTGALSSVAVPEPAVSDIIDHDAAVVLGKALFWDMQAGGDGVVACATCHHSAGIDPRRLNTVNPGPNAAFQAVPGANNVAVLQTMIAFDDIFGSQGVTRADFTAISPDPDVAADMCVAVASPAFGAARQVTGRNTPTVINSVFNRDNFWDGRANHTFNGLTPFGQTGNAAGSLVSQDNSSLASQAVGPPGNGVEMSCAGRAFNGPNSLGAKLLARQPLHLQVVHPQDGVLGSYSSSPAPGMRCGKAPCTYTQLIAAAFGTALATDAQAQFSRIWGQAVQAYEGTLVSDDTPYDRFSAGDVNALTTSQQRGLGIFNGKGQCAKCHAGNEFTDASVAFYAANGPINEDGGDTGFHNIGVRPTAEDLGRAGAGPAGVPWSVSGAAADHGAFKTPSLRNAALQAPYHHNGGIPTLEGVVAFYSQGGFFNNAEKAKRIKRLNFSATESAALVDFLRNGLTDCRVAKERAPFDHPSLKVSNGTDIPAVGADGTGGCP